MWRGFLALVAAVGCGAYSVRLEPPPPPVPVAAAAPLDLTVSLAAVETRVDGRDRAVDEATLAAVDADFVRAANASGLFRSALPHGSQTDLRCDVRRELHSVALGPGRSAYLLLNAPLIVLAPGFPYPWDYRIERVVALRGDVDGTSIPLLAGTFDYDARVWGVNYWGGRAVDPLRESEGDYLVGALADAIGKNRALLADFETAARAHDVEGAWLVSLRAASAR